MVRARILAAAVLFTLVFPMAAFAATHEVSDLDALTALVQHTAEPGDVIVLDAGTHYFKADRIRVERSGTPEAPIIIRGADGPRPVIDAEQTNVMRCIFNVKPGVHDVVFEHLEMRNARGKRFPDRRTYGTNACAIYFEGSSNITVRDCYVHHCEVGMFATHDADCILIENCEIAYNGTLAKEEHKKTHNFYFCAVRQMVRGCYIHHSIEGENFKSRAANTIFANNWVDEDAVYSVAVDSGGEKNTLWVGNVIMKRTEPGHGQGRLLGVGDGTGTARGTLVVLGNTLVTVFPRDFYLFTEKSSTADVVLINNVCVGPGEVFLDGNGKGSVTGSHNWLQKGLKSIPEGMKDLISGDAPGFVDAAGLDFRPGADSPLVGAAMPREEYMKHVKLVTDNARDASEIAPSPIWLAAVDEVEKDACACQPNVQKPGCAPRSDASNPAIGAYAPAE
jgi:hypothetical protein